LALGGIKNEPPPTFGSFFKGLCRNAQEKLTTTTRAA